MPLPYKLGESSPVPQPRIVRPGEPNPFDPPGYSEGDRPLVFVQPTKKRLDLIPDTDPSEYGSLPPLQSPRRPPFKVGSK